MKKNLLLLATASIFALASCQNEIIENIEDQDNQDVQNVTPTTRNISLVTSLNDASTKTTISDAEGLRWISTDRIGVLTDAEENLQSSEAEINASTLKATFTASSKGAKTIQTYFPCVAGLPTINAGHVLVDIPVAAEITQGQIGTLSGSYIPMYGVSGIDVSSEDAAVTGVTVENNMQIASALLQLRIFDSEVIAGDKIKTVKVTADKNIVGSITLNWDKTTGAASLVNNATGNSVTVSLGEQASVVKTVAEAPAIYVPILPVENATLTYVVTTNSRTFTFSSTTPKTLEAGKVQNIQLNLSSTKADVGYDESEILNHLETNWDHWASKYLGGSVTLSGNQHGNIASCKIVSDARYIYGFIELNNINNLIETDLRPDYLCVWLDTDGVDGQTSNWLFSPTSYDTTLHGRCLSDDASPSIIDWEPEYRNITTSTVGSFGTKVDERKAAVGKGTIKGDNMYYTFTIDRNRVGLANKESVTMQITFIKDNIYSAYNIIQSSYAGHVIALNNTEEIDYQTIPVLIDGEFDDWDKTGVAVSESKGDRGLIQLRGVADETYLYLLLRHHKDDAKVSSSWVHSYYRLSFDTDNNSSTGAYMGASGIELKFDTCWAWQQASGGCETNIYSSSDGFSAKVSTKYLNHYSVVGDEYAQCEIAIPLECLDVTASTEVKVYVYDMKLLTSDDSTTNNTINSGAVVVPVNL